MARKDILLDFNYDMVVGGNDMVLGDSDNQHLQLILKTFRGNWTKYPNLGVGIERFLKGRLDGSFRRELQIQMQSDGYNVSSIEVQNGGEISLKYTS